MSGKRGEVEAWELEAEGSPSCLDTSELTVEIHSADVWLETARDNRDKLIERLLSEGDEKTAAILEGCGAEVFLRCTECHARKRVFTHCKKRYCPLCAPMMAAERVEKHMAAVRALKWPLNVNLTQRNTETISRAILAETLKNFRRLRQRVLWKRTVRGGFVALEITNIGNRWHPHLHILCDCEWLSLTTSPPSKSASKERKASVFKAASAELEKEWAELIGQAHANVFVQRAYGLHGQGKAASEAIKYTIKPQELITCKGRARDVIAAMTGLRLFRGFGTCAKLKLDETTPREPCACEDCGEMGSFRPEEVVAAGEVRAVRKAKRR